MNVKNTTRQRNRNHLIFFILVTFNIILFLYFYVFSLHSGEPRGKSQVLPSPWRSYLPNTSTRKTDKADADISEAINDFERTHKLNGNGQPFTAVDSLASQPLITMRSNQKPTKDKEKNGNDANFDRKENWGPEKLDGNFADDDVNRINKEPVAPVNTIADDRDSLDDRSEKSFARENKADISNEGVNKGSMASTDKANILNTKMNKESTGEESQLINPVVDRIGVSSAQKDALIPNINLRKEPVGFNSTAIIPKGNESTASKYNGSVGVGMNRPEGSTVGNNRINTNVSEDSVSTTPDNKRNITRNGSNAKSIAQNDRAISPNSSTTEKNQKIFPDTSKNNVSTAGNNKANTSSTGINNKSPADNDQANIPRVSTNKESTFQNNKVNISSINKSIKSKNETSISEIDTNKKSTAPQKNLNIVNADMKEKSTSQEKIADFKASNKSALLKDGAIIAAQRNAETESHFL